ncbi:MAG: LPXTG cell wall anchor domain-containing protein [Ruminococcaceae bacterium]|nr:LPXTG cell wall anchor domain-containing protein [Oscillospiraceae bacterium]
MAKTNINKTGWIWLSVLVLLVCIAATAIALFGRLDTFLLDDEGAISLINDNASDTNEGTDKAEVTQAPSASAPISTEKEPINNTPETQEASTAPSSTEPVDTEPAETDPPKNPGFSVFDDRTVWSTNTQVEIFRISYMNGEQVVTVKSNNADKVIAPGTENSYTFKLKNTGNVPLNYTVELAAYFTPGDIEIPITGRLNRYDGKWVVGGQNEYVNVPALDSAVDHGSLGAGKYTYYTLDWVWPFDGENDELDTLLGNLATEQELSFTIVINTFAAECDDPDEDSGITPPQTGDNSNIGLWTALAICSFAMMLFLLFFRKKEKKKDGSEADKN